jgi:tetratricopeptide (TPR) repeat protein
MRGQSFIGFSGGRRQQAGIANLRDFFRNSVSVQPKTEGIGASRSPEAAEHYNIGTFLYSQGKFNQAILQFRNAIGIDPEYAEAYNNLGIAHSALGKFDEAIACLNKAIKLNPNDARAYYNRGNAHLAKRDYDGAITDFGLALVHPEFAEAYNGLGLAYEGKSNHTRAVEYFDMAIYLNPEYADAYANRAAAHLLQGKTDEAEADKRTARSLRKQ